MMPRFLDDDRRLYTDVWSVEAYQRYSPGATLVPAFLEMAGLTDRTLPGFVLDAGCGAGAGSLALQARGCVVTACDLVDVRSPEMQRAPIPFVAVPLWADLARATGAYYDYVYCCDVLEHIPPEFTMLVIDRLLRVATTGVFLSIAFVKDSGGQYVGQDLHRSLYSFAWWRDHLALLGDLVEARDCLQSGLYYVRPQ